MAKKKTVANPNAQFTFIFSNSMSFHLSIDTERTNDKCTPRPRCFPEHSRQIHIPYVTDTHCGLWVPHSKHFYRKKRIYSTQRYNLNSLSRVNSIFCIPYFHWWVVALVKSVWFVDWPFFIHKFMPTTHFNTHTHTHTIIFTNQIKIRFDQSKLDWKFRLID